MTCNAIPLFNHIQPRFFSLQLFLRTYKSKTGPAILYYGARRFLFTSP